MIKNEAGFTLIECLLSLVVLLATCWFVLPVIHIHQQFVEKNQQSHFNEWQIFLLQLEYQSRTCSVDQVIDNRLFLTEHKEGEQNTIVVDQFKNRIRWSKNKGYQPLLIGIKQFEIKQVLARIQVRVVFENDEEYQAFLALPN